MTTCTLVLVRHAKAQGHSPSGDRARRLTTEGFDQAQRLGRELSASIGGVDVAVASTAVRAVETLDGLTRSLRVGREWEDDALYLGGLAGLIGVVRALEGPTALVVGHEPTISMVGAGLVADARDREGIELGIPTATALVLGFEGPWADLEEGTCSLRVVHAPLHPGA